MKEPKVILGFEDVSVHYDDSPHPALDRFSLTVRAGERVALLGLNGSGKTTLLLAAVGLVPFSGHIRVDGEELTSQSVKEVRRRVGFLFSVPEDQILLPRVIDDVAFTAMCRGWSPEEALRQAEEALKALDAERLAPASPHRLSHGQRLRVALAGAIVATPQLLLLDEPTGGLDPPGKNRLADLIMSLPSAVVVATHDLTFARRVCRRYLLLESGQLSGEGEDFGALEVLWGM